MPIAALLFNEILLTNNPARAGGCRLAAEPKKARSAMIPTKQNRAAFRAAFCLALLLLVPHGLKAQPISGALPCAAKDLQQTATVDGYKFESYRNSTTGLACLQVVNGGRVIFRDTNNNAGTYMLGQHPDRKQYWNVPNIPDGADITRLGYPDMIVPAYSGGAHCCLSIYLFQLKPEFHLLATLDAEDSWPAYFSDPNHHHHYYFYSNDWTFAYWPSSFAGSPTAPIVLKFVKRGASGSFHLALDKMRKPPPTLNEWTGDLKTARSAFSQGAEGLNFQPALWSYVMQLMYSGHSDLAWKFLNEAWPPNIPGKANWTGDFCSRLKTSLYWPDLKVEVRDAPPACANAKPAPNR